MNWNKIKISEFLKERKDRFKPLDANKLGFKRISKIDFSGNIHITNNLTNTGMILVKKGDLVISGINVEKGALAVYEGDEDILATIHYSSYEYNKNKIDVEYLKWFLKSDIFKNILLKQAGGGIKTELKPKRFLPLEVYLPDLDTQIEIRNKILAVEKEIDEIKYRINEEEIYVKKLRERILQEAVSGELVEQNPQDEPASILLEKIKKEKEELIKEKKIKKDKPLREIEEEEIPYALPNNWEWVRFQDLLALEPNSMKRGPFGGSLTKSIFVKEGYLVYEQRHAIHNDFNYEKYYIDEITYEKMIGFKVEPEDFIISCSGSLGRIAEIPKNAKEGIINQALLKIKINNSLMSNDYFLILFKSSIFQNKLVEKATGSAIVNMIGVSQIKKLIVGVPPLNEQKRIVEKVDTLMQFCDELEEEINNSKERSQQLMQSVLREAFTEK